MSTVTWVTNVSSWFAGPIGVVQSFAAKFRTGSQDFYSGKLAVFRLGGGTPTAADLTLKAFYTASMGTFGDSSTPFSKMEHPRGEGAVSFSTVLGFFQGSVTLLLTSSRPGQLISAPLHRATF